MVRKIITSADFVKDESTEKYLSGVGEATITLFLGYETQEEFVKEFNIYFPPKTAVPDTFSLIVSNLCAKAVVYTYRSKSIKAERDLNEFLDELLDNGWELLTDIDGMGLDQMDKGGEKDGGSESKCPF